MQNVYRLNVNARCPADHGVDLYEFRLESRSIIICEEINKWFAANAGKRRVYQEDLTQQCATHFGCRVVSVGHHSGIIVTCECP